jgi:glycosyltransferase involved in cell wall biosynthesis
MEMRKKILLLADWYAPGFRAGGPIRSCVNFTNYMQGDYEVYVLTTDRDLHAGMPYPGITADRWGEGQNGEKLFYFSPGNLNWTTIRRQIRSVSPDFIYLNSMFSTKFTILPLLICRFYNIKTRLVLSPRGMLRSSAVQFKAGKKKLFLRLFRWLGISDRIHFLASDTTEEKDVRHYFGAAVKITVIPNFPAPLPQRPPVAKKNKGELTMVCIGRVHPIKNTDFLLDVLAEARAEVRLTIVGSLEDQAFWEQCQQKIRNLPANITVTYAGELPNDQLPQITSGHHIFVLPTRGENFGHAIFEALLLGKPVLISDQTPWLGLVSRGAGWDLPLGRPDVFRQAVEEAALFDQEAYTRWSDNARRYAEEYLSASNFKEAYIKLFS